MFIHWAVNAQTRQCLPTILLLLMLTGVYSQCPSGLDGPACKLKTENVAINKPANQGPVTKKDLSAELAVDGDTDQTSNYAWSQERSTNGTGAWWWVNLGDVHKIHKINVLFYTSTVHSDKAVLNKRVGFSLFVSTTSDTVQPPDNMCYRDRSNSAAESQSIAELSLTNCSSSGQYVILVNSRKDSSSTYASDWPNLQITEVQVFADKGCEARTYGPQCEQVCGCDSCDRTTGACPAEGIKCTNCLDLDDEAQGCQAGWYSNLCQMRCPGNCARCEKDSGVCSVACDSGHYGDYCNMSCPSGCRDNSCYPNGTCSDCKDGYYGDNCNKNCSAGCVGDICNRDGTCLDCKDGMHGSACNEDCPENCATCVKETGVCKADCNNGYWGDYCNNTCPTGCLNDTCKSDGTCSDCKNGYYGDSCNNPCPVECLGDICKPDGTCSDCKDGKHGTKCTEICHPNCINGCFQNNATCKGQCGNKYFGDTCAKQCNKCKTRCHANGTCSDGGCMSGYFGEMCNTECSSTCKRMQLCSQMCDRETGSCSCGCIEGYHGDYCIKTCPTNCTGNVCSQSTGHCVSCPDNWHGDICDKSCTNCLGDVCYRNGTCKTGCQPGYYGQMCDELCSSQIGSCVECSIVSGQVQCLSCKDAKYGDDCSQSCSANCELCKNETNCNKCKPRFAGKDCSQQCNAYNCTECDTDGTCTKCIPGLFGGECEYNCSDCETCIASTDDPTQPACITCKKGMGLLSGGCYECQGECASCETPFKCIECKDGYHGSRCTIACPNGCTVCQNATSCSECKTGYFGPVCQCSSNCKQGGDVSDWCRADGQCKKGCVPGRYGTKCNNDCDPACPECEQAGGACTVCIDGYHGLFCDKKCGHCGEKKCILDSGACKIGTACMDGYYGDKCMLNCSENCGTDTGGRSCDRRTGHCYSCKSGFYGDTCEETCSSNCQLACVKDSGKCNGCKGRFYGDTCDQTCGIHCETACHQDTGRCGACKSSYYGNVCDIPCPEGCGPGPGSKKTVCHRDLGECLYCKSGFYDNFCNMSCDQNCALSDNKPNCGKADGKCHGCKIGRYGEYCETGCSEKCMPMAGGDTGECDQTTGNCLGGCVRGAYGLGCDRQCPSKCFQHRCHQLEGDCNEGCQAGWFNSSCSDKCSSTCTQEQCNQTSGLCLLGCIDKYEGSLCQELKAPPGGGTELGVILPIIVALLVVMVIIVIILFIRRNLKKSIVGKANGKPREPGKVELGHIANGSSTKNMPVPDLPERQTSVLDDDMIEADEAAPLMSDGASPDYYNLQTRIQVAMFADYVQNRKNEDPLWYKEEFTKIPRGLLMPHKDASIPANKGKCRYKDLYPFDHNRVKLDPDGDSSSDFINASYINGYKKPQAFIASQGPIAVNLNDFWRMIWQKDCGKLVMLTNLFEECKTKCVRYWPEEDQSETYGRYEVTTITETVFPNYTVRHLQATNLDEKETKDMKHFHYTAWPDRGVPDNPSVILNFRDKVMDDHNVPDGPILVHCSAGIGRTGTFIALDYLLRQAHKETHIDVFNTVMDMRNQRTNFVQTDIQYEFVHSALVEALTTKDTEVAASNFCEYYMSLKEGEESGHPKLKEQFERLNQRSPMLDEICFTSGLSDENFEKNRCPEILPVDKYRAFLSTPVQGSNDYINAVFLPTVSCTTAFIATQMPLPHTITDFWRLVYDHRVTTIVMLNNVSDDDDDDETIGEYWPVSESRYGPFQVELMSCDNQTHFIINSIQLTYTSSSGKQTVMTVKQFRFKGWPDNMNVPESTQSITSMIGEVLRVTKEHHDEPTIVHCMDGAVRSGLYCVVAAILERLRNDEKVNIPQTILQLRGIRPQLIPTLEQFDFCHRVVHDYMEESPIYSNV